jgi:hypothetical protein
MSDPESASKKKRRSRKVKTDSPEPDSDVENYGQDVAKSDSLIPPCEYNIELDTDLCNLFKYLGYGNIKAGYNLEDKVQATKENRGARPEHLRRGVHDVLAAFGVTTYVELTSAMPIVLSYDRLGAAVPAGCHMDLFGVLGYVNKNTETLTREVSKVVKRNVGKDYATNAERAEFHRKYGYSTMKGKSSSSPPKVYLKELPHFSGKNHDWALWKDNVSSVLLQCGLHQVISDPDYAKTYDIHSKMVYGMILEVFNKPSCEGDYLCKVDESGDMNGYALWSQLETTYESPQVLKQVLKFKLVDLTNLRCSTEEAFVTFVRDFMRLRKLCDAYNATIKKHKYKDVVWTLPTTDKEWKDQLTSKINISSLQNCRTRCEKDTSLSTLDTIREFHGDLLEYNLEIRNSFETSSTQKKGSRTKYREDKPGSDTKKEHSPKEPPAKEGTKDNARSSVFSELHKAIKNMTTAEQATGNKLIAQIKSAGTKRRRKSSATAKKRQRRTKARAPPSGDSSDGPSDDQSGENPGLYSDNDDAQE